MKHYTHLYKLASLTDDTRVPSEDVAIVLTLRGEVRIDAAGTVTLNGAEMVLPSF